MRTRHTPLIVTAFVTMFGSVVFAAGPKAQTPKAKTTPVAPGPAAKATAPAATPATAVKPAPAAVKPAAKGTAPKATQSKGTAPKTATAPKATSSTAVAKKSTTTAAAGTTATRTSTTTPSTASTAAAWTPNNPVAEKLSTKTSILNRVKTTLPANTDLNAATSGFKNFGQFVAAVNVSKNLGIPFADLKAAMTGTTLTGQPTKQPVASLGQAIRQLKGDVDPTSEAQKASAQADAEINGK